MQQTGRNCQHLAVSEEILGVMNAILTTSGPLVNHQGIKNKVGSKKFNITSKTTLSTVSTHQFSMAAKHLEARNLGQFIIFAVCVNGRKLSVFSKNPPEVVAPILEADDNLCSAALYTERYRRPIAASITWKQRSALVEQGYVSEKLFMKR